MGFVNFQEGLQLDGVNIKIINLLKSLESMSWDGIEKLKIEEKEAMELEIVLRYHIERVIEGRLKSRQLLRKI